jgi:diguanylate cyclase (GGDEF)-like protein
VRLRASRGEARTGALTGLGNRRLLLRALAAGCADRARPRTLVFFDLDGFKACNDAFGHVAGDALLVRLARKLAERVQGRGSAYRRGGDEFRVLLDPPAADADDGAIAAAAAALEERANAFTASYGVAQLPREAVDGEQAVRLADERMDAHEDSRAAAARTRRTACSCRSSWSASPICMSTCARWRCTHGARRSRSACSPTSSKRSCEPPSCTTSARSRCPTACCTSGRLAEAKADHA